MLKKRLLGVITITTILLLLQSGAFAQRTITGSVKDEQGKPLAKATVVPKGAKAGVTTTADGSFSISVPDSINMLTVSFAEFDARDISIKGTDNVNVQLKPAAKKLEEVVVNVGYTTQKIKDVTSAITQVKGEAVKNLATQDAATLLQGRVAGVDVITPSGQPGASAQITIRGVASLNNADPLYIIDGVRQANGNNINPQDIETMSVLKDASAAAIYGAAAAGGVILITTKKGKGTIPTINFGVRYGQTNPRLIPLLNKKDFLDYANSVNVPYFNVPNPGIDTMKDIDWNKELYRNGIENNYYLSISAATPTLNYYLSGLYNKQDGVFLDNATALAAVRLNSDVKITNSIKIGEQLSVSTRSTTPVKAPVVSTPFQTLPIFTGPAFSLTPGGAYGAYPYPYAGNNPVAQIKLADFDFPETNFQGQVYLEAKLPVKYMTFKTTFGYTAQTYQNNIYQQNLDIKGQPKYNVDGSVDNSLYRNKGNYQQTLNAYILAYDHTWGKHTVNLLAGYEQYENKSENLLAKTTNVLGTSYGYIPGTLSISTVEGGYDPNGLVKSTFGRVHYNLNKKYDLEFTIRRDGNFTNFPLAKHYGVFPAVSGAWNIGDEQFFKKYRSTFNSLKLRASYGELGNSNIGTYKYVATYNRVFSQNFAPDGRPILGYTQQSLPNNELQWESTHETNIGLDGEMLNGKIYFTIDWYNKTTTDLLYNVPVAFSSGVYPGGDPASGELQPSTYLENIGSVRNRGIDIALGYKGRSRNFNYTVGVTGSFNSNEVLSLDAPPFNDGSNAYPYTTTSPWTGNLLTHTQVGQPFGQFWGLRSLGIYQENDPRLAGAPVNNKTGKAPQAGDLIFYDKNNDGRISADDDTLIGNPYPKFTFGVNFTATWKNFDIAILFNGAMGVDLYNGVTPYEFENGDNSNVGYKVFQSSGFSRVGGTPNGVTQYPRVYDFNQFAIDPYQNYIQPSSYFVENGSYIKLKNIQIGYNVSSKILQKTKIKNLRIYVMANNLFAITSYTGVDPELGSQFSTLSVDKDGNVVGNANGSASASHGGVTNRGIDGPAKYPSVRLYAAGIDLTF